MVKGNRLLHRGGGGRRGGALVSRRMGTTLKINLLLDDFSRNNNRKGIG